MTEEAEEAEDEEEEDETEASEDADEAEEEREAETEDGFEVAEVVVLVPPLAEAPWQRALKSLMEVWRSDPVQ